MMREIDALIDSTTMYRLLLYILLGYLALGAIQAYNGLLPFSPTALLASAAFLVLICWAANTLLAAIFNIPVNVESAMLTGLILALILDPATSTHDLPFLGWAAILAMASKYILAFNGKHIFNPAAIAVVATAFALNQSASWWVGTASMLPGILFGGWLVVRKTRQGSLVTTFLLMVVATQAAVDLLQGLSVSGGVQRLLIQSPLFFFGSIMLTEPLTMPPTRGLKWVYAALTGFLFVPQIHLGSIYSTPELALVSGNLFAYLVSPKQKFALQLKQKTRLSSDTFDFAFTPPHALAFAPGQYMEWTLGHPGADRRGNRRYFTLASSPTEETVHLGVKFSERGSSFKRALQTLDGRAIVLAGQIAGDFTLPRDPRQKLAFIAGGIGITPFRSMLKYLLDTGQARDIVLFYANRTASDIVYRDVLNAAERQLGISTIYTLTDEPAIPLDWTGAVGRVDAKMVVHYLPDFSERTFYISGPPEMVRDIERTLKSLHVSRSRIKKDFFPGLA